MDGASKQLANNLFFHFIVSLVEILWKYEQYSTTEYTVENVWASLIHLPLVLRQ